MDRVEMPRLRQERALRAGAALAVAAVLGSGMVPAEAAARAQAQAVAARVYTAAQAEAGRTAYARECAVCHQENLQGSFEAPPLAGASFLRFWGDLTARDLFDRIRLSMPPERPGALGEKAYVDIVAYLLQANGAAPGDTALDASTAVAIASVAGGEAPGRGGCRRLRAGLGLRAGGGRSGSRNRGHRGRHGRRLPAGHRRHAARPGTPTTG